MIDVECILAQIFHRQDKHVGFQVPKWDMYLPIIAKCEMKQDAFCFCNLSLTNNSQLFRKNYFFKHNLYQQVVEIFWICEIPFPVTTFYNGDFPEEWNSIFKTSRHDINYDLVFDESPSEIKLDAEIYILRVINNVHLQHALTIANYYQDVSIVSTSDQEVYFICKYPMPFQFKCLHHLVNRFEWERSKQSQNINKQLMWEKENETSTPVESDAWISFKDYVENAFPMIWHCPESQQEVQYEPKSPVYLKVQTQELICEPNSPVYQEIQYEPKSPVYKQQNSGLQWLQENFK